MGEVQVIDLGDEYCGFIGEIQEIGPTGWIYVLFDHLDYCIKYAKHQLKPVNDA